MLEILSANIGNILIGGGLILVVALIVGNMIRDKRAGKNSCGCGCNGCPSSGMCHPK